METSLALMDLMDLMDGIMVRIHVSNPICLVVTGHEFYFSICWEWKFIIPTDFHIFRGVGIPPTSNFSGVINDHDRAPFPTQGGQSDRTMSFCKERSDPHAVRDPW